MGAFMQMTEHVAMVREVADAIRALDLPGHLDLGDYSLVEFRLHADGAWSVFCDRYDTLPPVREGDRIGSWLWEGEDQEHHHAAAWVVAEALMG